MTFFRPDQQLQGFCDRLVHTTCGEFSIEPNQIALTLLVYDAASIRDTATDPVSFWSRKLRGCGYRSQELTYPASLVKLFYMVALHEWFEQGMISVTPEIDRALRDTIVDSSNDATGLIVDVLSGTTGGSELADGPFRTWQYQRQIVNRYFHNLGIPEYSNINVCQKTWCDGPYGRERAFYGVGMENRNMLTSIATSHLLHLIIGGMAVTRERSSAMRQLLGRSLAPETLAADPYNQVTGFLGAGLPPESQLWSKAGLTSKVRHDAAYVEILDKPAFNLIVFTEGHATNEEILPFIASTIVQEAI